MQNSDLFFDFPEFLNLSANNLDQPAVLEVRTEKDPEPSFSSEGSFVPFAIQSVVPSTMPPNLSQPPGSARITISPSQLLLGSRPDVAVPPLPPRAQFTPQAWIPAAYSSSAQPSAQPSAYQIYAPQPAAPLKKRAVASDATSSNPEQKRYRQLQASEDTLLAPPVTTPRPKVSFASTSLLTYEPPASRNEGREAHKKLQAVLNQNLTPIQQSNIQEIIARKKIILAQKMGSGKTRQALISLFLPMWEKILLSNRPQSFHPSLIVCGKTLFNTWRAEIENINRWLTEAGLGHLKINYTSYNPAKSESSRYNQLMSMGTSRTHICFVTYDTLKMKDHLRILSLLPKGVDQKRSKTRRWRAVIFDESHNLKKIETKRSKGAVTLLKRSRPEMVVAMTGTPVDNQLSDLCGQLALLNPRLFNKKWAEHFKQKVSDATRHFLKGYVNNTLPKNWEQTLFNAKTQFETVVEEEDQEDADSSVSDEEFDNDVEEIDFEEAVELDDDATEYYKLKRIENVGAALQYVRGLVKLYILQNNKPAATLNPAIVVSAVNNPQRIQENVFWEMSTFQALLYKAYEDVFLRTPVKERNTMLFIQTLCKVCDYPPLIEKGKSEKNKELYDKVQEHLQKTTLENVQLDDIPRVVSSNEHQKLWVSGKLQALKNKLLDIARASPENKVIVFVNLRHTAKVLVEDLKLMGFDPILVTGSLDEKARNDLINDAKNTRDPTKSILILTEGVGSEGLCLPEFNYVVNFDLPWSPNKLAQQIARIDRMGQTRQVHVVNFVCTNNFNKINLDKYFRLMHEVKTKTAASALNPAQDDPLIGLIPEVEVDFESLIRRAMEPDVEARSDEAKEPKEAKEKKDVAAPDVPDLLAKHLDETKRKDIEAALAEVDLDFCSGKTALDALQDLLRYGHLGHRTDGRLRRETSLKMSQERFEEDDDAEEFLRHFTTQMFTDGGEEEPTPVSSPASSSSSDFLSDSGDDSEAKSSGSEFPALA